jgi:hypothetical protein
MSVHQLPVYQMSFDQMSFDQMSVDQMSVVQMSVVQTWCQPIVRWLIEYWSNVCWPSVSRQNGFRSKDA